MMKFIDRMVARVVPDRYRMSHYAIHPGANDFLDLVEQEQYDDITASFLPLPASEKSLLVQAVSAIIEQDEYFDYWTTLKSGSALAHLMRGALLINRAAFYRGGGLGSELSEQAVMQMLNALRAAISSLERVRGDAGLGQEAAAWMIRGTMTSDYDWDFRRKLLTELRTLPAPHLAGELRYLVASCEKWFGSHDEMFQHARNSLVHFKTNPEAGALIAAAHYERHMYYDRFDEKPEMARAYLADPETMDEIIAASERLLSAPPSSPLDFVPAHNVFAAIFSEARRFDLAKPHFIGMEGRILAYPWYHHDDWQLQRWYNEAIRS